MEPHFKADANGLLAGWRGREAGGGRLPWEAPHGKRLGALTRVSMYCKCTYLHTFAGRCFELRLVPVHRHIQIYPSLDRSDDRTGYFPTLYSKLVVLYLGIFVSSNQESSCEAASRAELCMFRIPTTEGSSSGPVGHFEFDIRWGLEAALLERLCKCAKNTLFNSGYEGTLYCPYLRLQHSGATSVQTNLLSVIGDSRVA
ncbi:hypothetical protein N658DRAFT_351451 [Parathielavia hyrcaniae]|uniref:Uncharacterized protein n=1 Tax=Parathielavia hyrcaniae TaxID=113614 RepID=A0AAN6Q256_9PEZI|nr:hypothetical protein N658DRAFT_351451 [Parathielavia hyrcaniae]